MHLASMGGTNSSRMMLTPCSWGFRLLVGKVATHPGIALRRTLNAYVKKIYRPNVVCFCELVHVELGRDVHRNPLIQVDVYLS